MKISLTCFLAAVVALAPVARAQNSGGPRNQSPTGIPPALVARAQNSGSPPPAASSPGSRGGPAPQATQGDAANNGMNMLERFFNSEQWSADTENGSFTFGNMRFDLGSNRLVRSRFERYLSLPAPEADEQKYQEILNKINDLLSVGNTAGTIQENTYAAWLLLFDAAKFELDGGSSMIIANQVYNAWRIRDEKDANLLNRATLDRDRKRQEDMLRSTNDYDAYRREQDAQLGPTPTRNNRGANAGTRGANNGTVNPNPNQAQAGNGGGGRTTVGGSAGVGPNGPTVGVNGNTSGASGDDGNGAGGPSLAGLNLPAPVPNAPQGATRGTFQYLDLLRTNAELTALDTQMAVAGLNAQMQFQTTSFYFLITRRFQHSLIAGEFYRHIFKGSNQAVSIGRNELSKFMDLRDMVPTVDTFEGLSRDAIADTKTGMKSVETAYDMGERWGALERLQETFLLGEFQPAVLNFDPAKRRVLFGIYRDARDLRKLIQTKDFAAVDELVAKLRAAASDFPSAEIQSAARTAQQTSSLALLAAKQSMNAGDLEGARVNMERAIDIWPLNPEIKNFHGQIDNVADVTGLWIPRFKDWLARGELRQIYNSRAELGMATLKDPELSAQLKGIVERMAGIDMMIAYADAAVKQKNGYAAWEMLVKAARLDPNDPVVARAQASLAPQVAPFVAALSAADRAAAAGEYATSLNYYLAAQDIYPTSELCSDGITDASQQLMAKLNPGGATARALREGKAAATPPSAVTPAAAPAAPAVAPAPVTTAAASTPERPSPAREAASGDWTLTNNPVTGPPAPAAGNPDSSGSLF